jgi:mono/diheme cytochrome c family protein
VTLALLGALLLTQVERLPFSPRPLSPFAMAKAEWLIRNRLPCLGCHELGGTGGRIGPSLSSLKRWRPPDYVYAIIRDPQRTVPGTMMPRVPMSEATLQLIANFLVQREPTANGSTPSLPPTSQVLSTAEPKDTPALYGRLCASCHGLRGRGDGHNARFLPVRPTAHADKAYMSTRSDDELYDAIAGGGYIMNRSNRMPPFGQTLAREQIWSLVRYLRTLCRCEGPAWSRDKTPGRRPGDTP